MITPHQPEVLAQGHGVSLRRAADGSHTLARHPTFVHRFWVLAAPVLGGLCAVAGFAAGELAAGIGLALATVAGTAWAWWQLTLARRVRVTWTPDGRFEVTRPAATRLDHRTIALEALAPHPEEGRRVRVVTFVSDAPGARTVSGKPATLILVFWAPEPPRISVAFRTRAQHVDVLAAAVGAALPDAEG